MASPLIVPTLPIVTVPAALLVETVIVPGLLGAWLNVIWIVSPCSIEPAVPPVFVTTVLIGTKRRTGVNATVGDVQTVAEVAWIRKHHQSEMFVPVTLVGELAGVENAP